jgi:hypothetical protein
LIEAQTHYRPENKSDRRSTRKERQQAMVLTVELEQGESNPFSSMHSNPKKKKNDRK